MKNYTVTKDRINLTVALPAGFTFSGATPLALVNCKAFVTDTMTTSATINTLSFDAAGTCLSTQAPTGSIGFVLIPICSDSTISKTMAHGLPFAIKSIIPNPTTGDLTVSAIGNIPLHYDVLGLLGQNLQSGELRGGHIDLKSLASGSYYLRLSGGGYAQTRRIVRE